MQVKSFENIGLKNRAASESLENGLDQSQREKSLSMSRSENERTFDCLSCKLTCDADF